MRQTRNKLYWTFSWAIAIIPALIFSFPKIIENSTATVLNQIPAIKNWGSDLSLNHFLLLSSLGVIIFILTSAGRFQEYKIHIDAIHFCRRQLNLFKYFSYMSIGYVFSFLVALYTSLFFKNPHVVKFFLSIGILLFVSTTFFLCFLIVKVFVLEEILDHLKLDEDLDFITSAFSGFDNLRKR